MNLGKFQKDANGRKIRYKKMSAHKAEQLYGYRNAGDKEAKSKALKKAKKEGTFHSRKIKRIIGNETHASEEKHRKLYEAGQA